MKRLRQKISNTWLTGHLDTERVKRLKLYQPGKVAAFATFLFFIFSGENKTGSRAARFLFVLIVNSLICKYQS